MQFVSLKKKKMQLHSMDVNCPVVQSSMMIKTKITVGQSVYSATVSVSQDTGFEVVVSLISSLHLVNVEQCDKVRAAHVSRRVTWALS